MSAIAAIGVVLGVGARAPRDIAFNHEIVDTRAGRRPRSTRPPAAFDAVADQDVSQRPTHLVAHRAAEATARVRLAHHTPGISLEVVSE